MLFQKMRFLLFLSMMGLGLSACSSGSGDQEVNGLPERPEDTVDPRLTSSYPESDQRNVEPDDSVRIEFSETMNLPSLMNGGIQLYSGSDGTILKKQEQSLEFSEAPGTGLDPVTGDVVDIKVTLVTLQPARKRFSLATTYTLIVFDSAKDKSLNPKNDSESEHEEGAIAQKITEFSFTIQDGQWQETNRVAVSIPDLDDASQPGIELTGDVFDPQIASNRDGDIFAVWRQAEVKNSVTRILASRYFADNGSWRPADPQLSMTVSSNFIDAGLETSAFSPEIAVNKPGLAAAVWYQSPVMGGPTSIWINVFENSQDGDDVADENYNRDDTRDIGAWSGATNILSSLSGTADSPKVVIDEGGTITVAWREFDDGYYRIKAASYSIVSGLSTPTTLAPGIEGDATPPQLEISPNGLTMLVWTQEVNGLSQVYTSRRVGDAEWSTAIRLDANDLDPNDQGNASAPSLAIDANNDAFVVWQQYDGKRENIWLNRFAGGGWGKAQLLETDQRGDAVKPSIAFGNDRQAFAIWSQDQDLGSDLMARLFVGAAGSNTGWAPPEKIASNMNVSTSMIKFDREGNAMVIWTQGESTSSRVSASRYSEATGNWVSDSVALEFSNASQGVVLEPLLEDGRMLALWYYFDGASFNLASWLFSD